MPEPGSDGYPPADSPPGFPYHDSAVNYFAHAIRFLDRPDFLAGLAVPDWLSVVDRRVRVRRRAIQEQRAGLAHADLETALGVIQHLDDDQWFHATAAFFEVTGTIGRSFRESLGPDETWHCGFLGHVVLELLLDAVLIEQHPGALEHYYNAIASVDAARVQQLVERLTQQDAPQLSRFIDLYVRERFLGDYLDDASLLKRLNQVMRRVNLPPLPHPCVDVLSLSRGLVRQHLADLLPVEHWSGHPEDTSGISRR